MKPLLKYTVVVALFSLCSCAATLYEPLPEDAREGRSLENLRQGRALYVTHCGSCHSLYSPGRFDKTVWQHNLDEMQVRSKISDNDKKLIFDYLISAPVSRK